MSCLTSVLPAWVPSLLQLPPQWLPACLPNELLYHQFSCFIFLLHLLTGSDAPDSTYKEGFTYKSGRQAGREGTLLVSSNVNRSNIHPTHLKLWEPRSKAVVKSLRHLYWQTHLS